MPQPPREPPLQTPNNPAGQCHSSQWSIGSGASIARQLEAISPPPPPFPKRRLLGNFKQLEPPMAAGTLFSGLLAMTRAIWAPTPQQGHRPQVSLGVHGGGGGKMGYPGTQNMPCTPCQAEKTSKAPKQVLATLFVPDPLEFLETFLKGINMRIEALIGLISNMTKRMSSIPNSHYEHSDTVGFRNPKKCIHVRLWPSLKPMRMYSACVPKTILAKQTYATRRITTVSHNLQVQHGIRIWTGSLHTNSST